MSRTQRIVAIVVAAYLLLAFLDEFVLVRLLATRLAVPLLLAVFEALAAIGAGFIARGLRGRVWRFDASRSSARSAFSSAPSTSPRRR